MNNDEVLRFAQDDMKSTKSISCFLFDMDGVLFDSMKNHAEAWYQVMGEHYGFACDRTVFYMYEGSTGQQTINAFFRNQRGRDATEREIEQIYTEKSNTFTQLGPALPMPGAAEVLRKVGEKGLKRVLVTGSGQRSLVSRLELTYPGVFDWDHIVWGQDCPIGHGKPHPDPYLMGLRKAMGNTSPVDFTSADPFGLKCVPSKRRQFALLPDEAIVVENAPMGVQAARAAGIFTIAVNTGPLDPQVLADAGANVVLSGMEELAARLDEILHDNGFRI